MNFIMVVGVIVIVCIIFAWWLAKYIEPKDSTGPR